MTLELIPITNKLSIYSVLCKGLKSCEIKIIPPSPPKQLS